MRKVFLFIACFCLYGSLRAAFNVAKAPVLGSGTPATITISSTTLTKVPTTQTSGRYGFIISVPSPNTGVAGFYGDCTSTANASTIRPIELSTGTGRVPYGYFSAREDVCLWLISLNTAVSGQTIHVQELKQ